MPYYAFNLLCGLDETGKGVIYGYDAVGSYDTLTYGAQGSGVQLGIPILDNQFIGHNFKVKVLPESQEEVENTAKDIINSIAERDIYTGDNVELVTVDANGVRTKREPVRRDWMQKNTQRYRLQGERACQAIKLSQITSITNSSLTPLYFHYGVLGFWGF